MKNLGYVVMWPFGWLGLALLGAYAVKKPSPVPLDLDDQGAERPHFVTARRLSHGPTKAR